MAYNSTNWVDNETPLSAQNLNKMEDGIKGAYDKVELHKADYELFKGDLSLLQTTAKDNIPSIINELFISLSNGNLSVSNGKTEIATAIVEVDPNLQANGSETFAELATLIRNIQTGKKWATGTTTNVKTAGGSSPYWHYLDVTGLSFRPSIVFAFDTVGSSFSDYYGVINTNPMPRTAFGGSYHSVGQNLFYYRAVSPTPSMYSPYVTSDGFHILMAYPMTNLASNNRSVTWIAIE